MKLTHKQKNQVILILLFLLGSIIIHVFITYPNYQTEKKEWNQALVQQWNECNNETGNDQEKCYDYYQMDWKEQNNKEYYINQNNGIEFGYFFVILLFSVMILVMIYLYGYENKGVYGKK